MLKQLEEAQQQLQALHKQQQESADGGPQLAKALTRVEVRGVGGRLQRLLFMEAWGVAGCAIEDVLPGL